MTASIPLRKYDAIVCIIYAEPSKKRLNERSSLNPLRIPRPKIDKLACQAQGEGIFAIGEIPLLMQLYTFLNHGILIENCGPAFKKFSLKIPKK